MSELTLHKMECLALNALSGFTLTGLFNGSDGHPASAAALTRKEMPQDLIRNHIERFGPNFAHAFTDPPARRSSTQPPPGSGRLEASLGDYIGHGHSSAVFSLKGVTVLGVTPGTMIPPLVVKIARLNRVTSLMREAWFYDEMECLQGASIARCYGYFEMELHEDFTKTALVQLARKYPSSDGRGMNPVLERDRACGPLHPLLEERSHRNDVMAVLVLERLGLPLPLGQPVSKETQNDSEGCFEDLAHLGICNIHDIRLPNILEASGTCLPGLPSLPSPFSNKTRSWRLIDFELAQKVNYSVRLLRQDYRSDLAGVYEEAMTTYSDDENSWTDWEGSENGYSSNEDHPAGH